MVGIQDGVFGAKTSGTFHFVDSIVYDIEVERFQHKFLFCQTTDTGNDFRIEASQSEQLNSRSLQFLLCSICNVHMNWPSE